ncbi:MAG: Abi family protein, partial [Akkermansia sp.]
MKHFYRKPFLTFEQQADQLIDRGLHVQKKILMERLSEVSYFRLSAYWYSFRKNDPDHEDIKIDTFEEGTSFDAVWERYRFDRKLRFLLLDAV